MICIVGNSRTGTTMLGRILGRNSAIHTFSELHFFEHQNLSRIRNIRETIRRRLFVERKA
jgi:hypothetical protein